MGLQATYSSRRSSGSMRAESAVEPTKSENITVTWRRSARSSGWAQPDARDPKGAWGHCSRAPAQAARCHRYSAQRRERKGALH